MEKKIEEKKVVENKEQQVNQEEKLVIVNEITKKLSVVQKISKTNNPYYVVEFELVNGYKNNLFLSRELSSLIQLDLDDGLLLKDIIKSCDLVKGVGKNGNNYYAVKIILSDDYNELIFMPYGVTHICDRLSK